MQIVDHGRTVPFREADGPERNLHDQQPSLDPIYMIHYPSKLFLKQANLPSAQFLSKWSHVSSWQTGEKPLAFFSALGIE